MEYLVLGISIIGLITSIFALVKAREAYLEAKKTHDEVQAKKIGKGREDELS